MPIITDDKNIEIFCATDDFCKKYDEEIERNLVHFKHRSVNNFMMNLIVALGTYCFVDNKPESLQVYCIENTKLLMLF